MNVAEQITIAAKKFPLKTSVVAPVGNNSSYLSYTFSELESRINQFSNKLVSLGVKKGDKVLVFIKPNIDFAAIVFSVFKVGAVGVFIDPGMGKDKLLKAIRESNANVLIGLSKVHVLRRFFKKPFSKINIFISNSKSSFFANSIYKGLDSLPEQFIPPSTNLEDTAALLYTSGGTGKPKGVVYTHDIFIEQTKKLQSEFSLTHNDTDLAGFPLFAMFTLSMGMKSVIPFMDPSKPAKAKGRDLLKNIEENNVSFVSGSPAIWNDLLSLCHKDKIQLNTVKYFVMFGAPISYSIHEKFSSVLPNGTTYTPYGATECLPVSNISGQKILTEFMPAEIIGKGICIGDPLEGVDVKIISISELEVDKIHSLPVNEIGEIIVSSSTVTKEYYKLENKTKLAKIFDGEKVWHRMGDTGYIDSLGRIWFTGRVAHSFLISGERFFSIPTEQYFLGIRGVIKVAFVNVSLSETALIVEGCKSVKNKIQSIIDDNKLKVNHILFHPKFPVDIRHNIKIDRKALSEWAKEKLNS